MRYSPRVTQSPSEPRPHEYQALASFRHLIRRFLVFSEEAARKAGLRPQQHQLLLALKGLPPDRVPTIGELAWRLQLKNHSVVELADRLAKRGMIRRHRNVNDFREVLLEITPMGERILLKLSVSHREELRQLAPELLPALSDLFPGNSGQPRNKKDVHSWPTSVPRSRRPTVERRKTPGAFAPGDIRTMRRSRADREAARAPDDSETT
jgi:DNA-binding MarR family transcriptional regulator